MSHPSRFNHLWKELWEDAHATDKLPIDQGTEEGTANLPGDGLSLGKPGQCSPLSASSSDDPSGKALFEFKGTVYLATFPADDPRDVQFVALNELPYFLGGEPGGSDIT